jgi:hypothetical protein
VSEHPTDDASSPVPDEVEVLAAARAAARAERDFERADELKRRIEAAGWMVVDDGARYSLAPARARDTPDAGRTVYGSPAGVPSRLESEFGPGATVIVLVTDLDRATATVSALAGHREADLVLVAADGALDRSALLEGVRRASNREPLEVGGAAPSRSGVEVLWTRATFGPASALVAGLRRAGRELVIVIDEGVEPDTDPEAPIAAALGDESVAAVGTDGLASADLHRFTVAGPDDLVALGPGVMGFRRADAGRLLSIDERLASVAGVIAWSSLALRERGGGRTARRVLVVGLPLRERPSPTDIARRDRYRLAARFGADPGLRTP